MKKLIAITITALLISACAPWVRMGGPFTAGEQNINMDLPDGWMRWNTKDYLLITRDGLDLQTILVESIHVSESLRHTKKKFRKEMLPLEAAEVILDNSASNAKVHGFEIKENKSAKIGGHPGFRAVYTYRNEDGLKMKGVIYGFMEGEWFYCLEYTAAQRHYFDRDLKTFEQVVASARLIRS